MRDLFLENNKEKIEDKVVLEVAAGKQGFVSDHILTRDPAKLIVSDVSDECLDFLSAKYKDNEKVDVMYVDGLDIDPVDFDTKVDTIVSAGYLYRTAHPLWHLSQLTKLEPAWIYVETLAVEYKETGKRIFGREEQKQINVGYWDEPLGRHWSYHHNTEGALPIAIQLPQHLQDSTMKFYGYEKVYTTNHSYAKLSQQPLYEPFFRNTVGHWYELVSH